MAVYGYARTSTFEQKPDDQIKKLEEAGVDKVSVVIEPYKSRLNDQPALNQLLTRLTTGDTLVVTKLDRLARNTKTALEIIQTCHDRHISLNVLNIGVLDDSPQGQLIYKIFISFAAFEKDMIASRTQEGKAYAKEHDPSFKDGRPRKYTDAQLRWAYSLRKEKGWTYRKISEETGVGRSTLYKVFKIFREEK